MELALPRGDDGEMIHVRVVKQIKDNEGNSIGVASHNPLLDSRKYEIKFADGNLKELTANIMDDVKARVVRVPTDAAPTPDFRAALGSTVTDDGNDSQEDNMWKEPRWRSWSSSWKDGTSAAAAPPTPPPICKAYRYS